MKSIQKRVISNITAIMTAKKFSIGKLSIESGLDKSYLSKLLRGERRMNLEQLESIAHSLDVDPVELFKK